MMIGKTAPIKMMNPAAEAVSPNQMIANGIQARGGIGRRISMRGSRKASKRRFQPMQDPDRDADKECHAKADGEVDQACLEIEEERPLLQQADKRREDIGRGGEDERVPDNDGRNKLPEGKRKKMRKDTEPPVLPVFLYIPSHGPPACRYPAV